MESSFLTYVEKGTLVHECFEFYFTYRQHIAFFSTETIPILTSAFLLSVPMPDKFRDQVLALAAYQEYKEIVRNAFIAVYDTITLFRTIDVNLEWVGSEIEIPTRDQKSFVRVDILCEERNNPNIAYVIDIKTVWPTICQAIDGIPQLPVCVDIKITRPERKHQQKDVVTNDKTNGEEEEQKIKEKPRTELFQQQDGGELLPVEWIEKNVDYQKAVLRQFKQYDTVKSGILWIQMALTSIPVIKFYQIGYRLKRDLKSIHKKSLRLQNAKVTHSEISQTLMIKKKKDINTLRPSTNRNCDLKESIIKAVVPCSTDRMEIEDAPIS